jgi:excisionase family DNA binding protein
MKYITINQAAERLGMSARTVRRYIKSGRLPASRLSRKTVRIAESDVQDLLGGGVCRSN